MNLTPEQDRLIKSLQDAGYGKLLTAFFEELFKEMCDIRTIPNLTPEVRQTLISITDKIRADFLDRINMENKPKTLLDDMT
jgi:hypothetical protein